MQTPRSNGYERRCATFINLPVSCTKVSKMRWKGRPRTFVSFAFEPPSQVLTPFRPLAPLLPEILGVTLHGHTTIPDAYSETTAMLPPPPPSDAHIPSSSQPTSQQPSHPATFAVKNRNNSQNTITIPKGRFPPAPLSAPPAVSASNPIFASPIDKRHPPQYQRQAHRAPKRTSSVPVPTNGVHSQGHIMNYIHATAHQALHQVSINHTTPMPISQPPPLQPQVTNRSVGSANPTPQPAEEQRQPIGISIQRGNPIADSIFSCTSD